MRLSVTSFPTIICASTSLRLASASFVDNVYQIGTAHNNEYVTSDNPSFGDLYPPNNRIPGPTISVPNLGNISGIYRAEYPSVAEFRGVPYAEPPIGDLRWQPPKVHTGWGEAMTFPATEYGNICWQAEGISTVGEVMSEDCLFLNIATPTSALKEGAKKLPVLLFLHGGGLVIGMGSEFDMAPIVASTGGNMIGITLNYRLNVFGLLGGDEAMARTNGAGAGQFAIQDQRAAMAWIKANIGAFGGDGEDITIYGQSSGGLSVLNHLVQPASFPYYRKAIISSGVYNQGGYPKLPQANDYYTKVLSETGCPSMECLLQVDAEELLAAGQTAYNGNQGISPMFPVIDGISLTDQPAVLFDNKTFNNEVPVLIGSNREEAASLIQLSIYVSKPTGMTEADFDKLEPYASMSPQDLAELKRIYGPESYSYPDDLGGYSIWFWMNVRIQTDTIAANGHCDARWLARKLLAGGTPSVYNYMFAKTPNFFDKTFAPHGSELHYVMNSMMYPVYEAMESGSYKWKDVATQDDREMGELLSTYWSTFAMSKNGDPNPDLSEALWQPFSKDEEVTLRFEDEALGGTRMQRDLRKDACDFQTKLLLERGGFPGFDPEVPGEQTSPTNSPSSNPSSGNPPLSNGGFSLPKGAILLPAIAAFNFLWYWIE